MRIERLCWVSLFGRNASHGWLIIVLCTLLFWMGAGRARAQIQEPESKAAADSLAGQRNLVIAGGGGLPESVFRVFREMAGPEPKLLVIPTASTRPVDLAETEELWAGRGFRQVRVAHAEDRVQAESDAFCEPLGWATAVWFGGGSQQRIADAYLGTRFEEELGRFAARGGVIGGTSAGAAIQSRVMIARGRQTPGISTGLDLLPDAIIDQHFLARNRIPRLMAAVRQHPRLVGFGVDEGTALVMENGQLRVVGDSYVLRVFMQDKQIKVEAFGHGKAVPGYSK